MRPDVQLEQLRPMAERVARGYGLEIFDVQFRREPIGWVLRVIIDRPALRDESGTVVVEPIEHAVGIDECQRVSEDLSAILDVEDAVDREYTLEVSSPGLDRRLRHEEDYRRFAGRLAKLVVTEAVDGQMHFEGRLLGVDGGTVLVGTGREKVTRVPLAAIGRAKLAVEF